MSGLVVIMGKTLRHTRHLSLRPDISPSDQTSLPQTRHLSALPGVTSIAQDRLTWLRAPEPPDKNVD